MTVRHSRWTTPSLQWIANLVSLQLLEFTWHYVPGSYVVRAITPSRVSQPEEMTWIRHPVDGHCAHLHCELGSRWRWGPLVCWPSALQTGFGQKYPTKILFLNCFLDLHRHFLKTKGFTVCIKFLRLCLYSVVVYICLTHDRSLVWDQEETKIPWEACQEGHPAYKSAKSNMWSHVPWWALVNKRAAKRSTHIVNRSVNSCTHFLKS